MLSTACRNKKEGRIRSRYEFALYSAWFSGICRAAGGSSPYTVYSSAILTAVSSAISIIWVKELWRSSAVRLSSGR